MISQSTSTFSRICKIAIQVEDLDTYKQLWLGTLTWWLLHSTSYFSLINYHLNMLLLPTGEKLMYTYVKMGEKI